MLHAIHLLIIWFRYHGALDRQKKIEFLQDVDILSVPSPYKEPKGLYLFEAMACGVPVAAFPVQGPLDVVGGSAAGVLHDELAVAIEQAVGIDADICRARALEHSWDQSVREFYANLVPFGTRQFTGELT